MLRSFLVRCLVTFAFIVIGAADVCVAQSSAANALLSLEDVVKDSKSGIPEDIIITKIKKNSRPFNLSSDEIRVLTESGISGTVIKYLIDPSQPYTQPPPPAAGQPGKPEVKAKNYPADALASRVPADAGLYLFVDDKP